MHRKIRKLFFGDENIREYSTISTNAMQYERVEIRSDKITIDVTQQHYLLCLEPLVFGVWFKKGVTVNVNNKIELFFIDKVSGKYLARLSLSYIDTIINDHGALFLLKVEKSKTYHLNFFATYLLYYKFYKKNQLSFQQVKGFASAYSQPRKVSIISFKQDDYYNIFPMDLLGDITTSDLTNYYAFGLRHSNNALSKIIETGRLVISEVSYKQKKQIYSLGSNHQKLPPAVKLLPFNVCLSKKFGFYIPEWVDSYKEVRITKVINLGSHMLLWGLVEDKQVLNPSAGNLFHIHYLLFLYYKRKGYIYSLV